MSADNGIYIAKFQDGYRVIEAQAIDNCLLDDSYPIEIRDAYRALYFGDCVVFDNLGTARAHASDIELDMLLYNFPILEYGVSLLDLSDRPFPKMSRTEAIETIDKYWDYKGLC